MNLRIGLKWMFLFFLLVAVFFAGRNYRNSELEEMRAELRVRRRSFIEQYHDVSGVRLLTDSESEVVGRKIESATVPLKGKSGGLGQRVFKGDSEWAAYEFLESLELKGRLSGPVSSYSGRIGSHRVHEWKAVAISSRVGLIICSSRAVIIRRFTEQDLFNLVVQGRPKDWSALTRPEAPE